MTVAELIHVLQQFKPDMQVIADSLGSGNANVVIDAKPTTWPMRWDHEREEFVNKPITVLELKNDEDSQFTFENEN